MGFTFHQHSKGCMASSQLYWWRKTTICTLFQAWAGTWVESPTFPHMKESKVPSRQWGASDSKSMTQSSRPQIRLTIETKCGKGIYLHLCSSQVTMRLEQVILIRSRDSSKMFLNILWLLTSIKKVIHINWSLLNKVSFGLKSWCNKDNQS